MSAYQEVFRVLLPTVFIAIIELALFLGLTKKEIDLGVQGITLDGQRKIDLYVTSVDINTQDLISMYMKEVHKNLDTQREAQITKRETNNRACFWRAIFINGITIVTLIALLLIMISRGEMIAWRSIGIETIGTVVGVTIFLVGFYFLVAKKYRYLSRKELYQTILDWDGDGKVP